MDYVWPFLSSVSVDASVNAQSRQFGQFDNAVKIRGYQSLDIGGRYKYSMAGHRFTARFQVSNLTNAYSLVVLGSGFYIPTSGRTASAYLSTDW